MKNLKNLLLVASSLVAVGCQAHPVTKTQESTRIGVETHTAKEAGFIVNSHLLLGERDALLVDAQFTRSEARALSQKIKASGRSLKTIFITHAHPDHYFGLEILTRDFPKAEVLARTEVVEEIRKTGKGKLEYWKKIYKDDLTDTVVIPKAFNGSELTLEGEKIQIVELQPGESEHSTVLYVPSLRALITDDAVYNRVHLWLAEDRPESWLVNLKNLRDLNATQILTGHGSPGSEQLITENENYIRRFVEVTATAKDKKAAFEKLKAEFADYKLPVILELGLQARMK